MEIQEVLQEVRLITLRYFAEVDKSQISHTVQVASLTALIADGLDLSERDKCLLEITAWLHDIGCPQAMKVYGNTRPVNQEKEGRLVASHLLTNVDGLTDQEKTWIVDVVGHHHQVPQAKSLQFEALNDADLIVNLLEGYYKWESKNSLSKRLLTEKGREYFDALGI